MAAFQPFAIDTDDLIRAYEAGEEVDQIATRLGVSKGFVYRRFHTASFAPDRGKGYLLPMDEIAVSYSSGTSEKALAERYRVSRTAIRRQLKAAGVTIRDPVAANGLMMRLRSPAEHRQNAQRAHDAARGRKATLEERMKSAAGRERNTSGASLYERRLAQMLADRGISTIPQQAIGPYNCDLGAHPVAVEVFGGNWHWSGRHMLRTPERFRYILDAGWDILVVKVESHLRPLGPETADYVASYVEERSRSPASRREYRVVRSAGELLTAGRADDDDISIVSTLRRRTHAGRADKDMAR